MKIYQVLEANLSLKTHLVALALAEVQEHIQVLETKIHQVLEGNLSLKTYVIVRGQFLGGRDESERRRAESQWIVAARPLCHLQYPVAYLSRLQRILPAA